MKDWTKTSDDQFAYRYPRPAVAADNVVFGFDKVDAKNKSSVEMTLKVLLIQRAADSRIYAGWWALPGGFLQLVQDDRETPVDETMEQCACRELREEAGVDCRPDDLTQFAVFSHPYRETEQRVLSIAYYALRSTCHVEGGTDAARAEWFAIDQLPDQLAFDHRQIIEQALQRLRTELSSKPIGYDLLPEEFTLPQLQRLYECILGKTTDRSNFQRKLTQTKPQILIETGESEKANGHRGGKLYRFNKQAYDEFMKKRNLRLEF